MNGHAGGSFPKSVGLLLFGPVIAAAHFLGLYLFAETACAAGWLRGRIAGMDGLSMITLVVTLAAAGATVLLSIVAYRRRHDAHGSLVFTGFLLGITFAIEIAFVGIPVAFLRPCG